jgi:hypothetical protein
MARSTRVDDPTQTVTRLLRGYAERGVFRSLSEGDNRSGRTTFTMVWHHGRPFRLVIDHTASLVSFPNLLPGIPSRSAMLTELRAFLRQFESTRVPEHRRIDRTKGQLRLTARGGAVTVGIGVKNGEWEYCTRRLVHLVQEIFMVFLPDGPYYEYRVEHLGLDPDSVWA